MVHFTTYHSLVISLSKKNPEFLTFFVLPSKLGFDSILDYLEATTNSAVINENNLLFVVFFFWGGGRKSHTTSKQPALTGGLGTSSTLLMQQGS